MAGLAAPVANAENVTNARFDLVSTAINTCNGELIPLTGTIHIVENLTGDGIVAVAFIHATGTGSDGNEYVLNERHMLALHASGFSTTQHVVLVSQGTAPNRHLTFTLSSPPFEISFDEECLG